MRRRRTGTPEANPVWRYWDGSNILIRSQGNAKVRNIAADPRVAYIAKYARALIALGSSAEQLLPYTIVVEPTSLRGW